MGDLQGVKSRRWSASFCAVVCLLPYGLQAFVTFNGFMASQLYPTAACLAAPGPRLRGGLSGFSGVLVTPLNQNVLSHRRRGK